MPPCPISRSDPQLMPGGNAMLKPDQQGLAELTARLLTDGSGDLDAQAMERWLSERAASMKRKRRTADFRHRAYRAFAF